jgi:hypothetical protein
MTENNGPDERDGSGIKVVDRRKFTIEGELRHDRSDEEGRETTAADATPEPEGNPSAGTTEVPEDVAAAQGFDHKPVEEPSGVDFTMLINAMAQPALFYLGEIPPPDGGEPVLDLEQARLQVDMLELLKVKSRGNLEEAESGLLDQVLYQLRMLVVARGGAAG